MVIPPNFMPASAAEIVHYYKTIDAAVGIPIILQDIPQAPVPPGMATRLAAECRNIKYIKVETLPKAIVIPTSAAQRGPAGTFSYVIGDDDTVTAKPIVVIQQNETDAVIGSGLTPSDRVVTTGFANLADGSKVIVGRDDQTPSADLAPRKRRSSRDAQGPKDGERRGKAPALARCERLA